MVKEFIKGILAVFCICLGCCVYLSCDNEYIGAILFSVALFIVCVMKFSLFTGKIGFILQDFSKRHTLEILVGLFGNIVGCLLLAPLVKVGLPELHDQALLLVQAKLTQTPLQTLIRAFFCGFLIYIAVYMFNHKDSTGGIILAIPTFILSGFEHSIADAFYFVLSMTFSFESILFIFIVLVGNSLGALVAPFGEKVAELLEKSKE